MDQPAGLVEGRAGGRLTPHWGQWTGRAILWVDGVGAWLVCLADRIGIGQAGPDSPADVPLRADLSRLHATIVREQGEYRLVAHRPTRRNGKPVECTPLTEGDRIGLGAVELEFRLPNPGSASARLQVTSGHRFPWPVDGVLLWADVLDLGPVSTAHVVCPQARSEVVLFRQADGLWCRSPAELDVAGRIVEQPWRVATPLSGLLGPIRAAGLSWALEPWNSPIQADRGR